MRPTITSAAFLLWTATAFAGCAGLDPQDSGFTHGGLWWRIEEAKDRVVTEDWSAGDKPDPAWLWEDLRLTPQNQNGRIAFGPSVGPDDGIEVRVGETTELGRIHHGAVNIGDQLSFCGSAAAKDALFFLRHSDHPENSGQTIRYVNLHKC